MGEDSLKDFLVLGVSSDGLAEGGNGKFLGVKETGVSGEGAGMPKVSAPQVDALFAVCVDQLGWFCREELDFVKFQLNLGLREMKAG